jgi:hypothetical protein
MLHIRGDWHCSIAAIYLSCAKDALTPLEQVVFEHIMVYLMQEGVSDAGGWALQHFQKSMSIARFLFLHATEAWKLGALY